jgi:probable rRNA maturation factor
LRKIHFNNNGISPQIANKQKLKTFLDLIFEEENIKSENVSYVFCTDNYLLELNQKYLNHNTLTDILTFMISNEEKPVIAEIYISIERVKENSLHFEIDYSEELLRVMIHGILHLCGYYDHKAQDKKTMRKRENYYISKYCST